LIIEDEGSNRVLITTETPGEREQLTVMIEALKVYSERNIRYKDNWMRMGWRGMLVRVRERSERLWDGLWDAYASPIDGPPSDPEDHDDELDDALDLINFAGFLVRAVRAGNRDGSWWKGV
jgi:hypothetical protein